MIIFYLLMEGINDASVSKGRIQSLCEIQRAKS